MRLVETDLASVPAYATCVPVRNRHTDRAHAHGAAAGSDQLDKERQRKIDETIERPKKEWQREIDERLRRLRAEFAARRSTHARCVLRRDQGESRSRDVAKAKGAPPTAILRSCWRSSAAPRGDRMPFSGGATLARLRALDGAGDETERDPVMRMN